jgi:hypothetical protein
MTLIGGKNQGTSNYAYWLTIDYYTASIRQHMYLDVEYNC